MSNKRFWWSVAAVWVVLMVCDWVFHGIWMHSMYQATASLWRPMEEMQKMMPLMWIGAFIWSWAFVWIYSKGISKANQWQQAFRYSWAIIAISHIPQLMGQWVVSPYPLELVVRWFFIGAVEAMLCAFVMTWTYKPMGAWAKASH
jgi:hypothetical protein